MWFIFQTAWKAEEGNITFSGEENSETIPFEECAKLHFSMFLIWFPRNPTLSDSAIQKAGKLASRAAGKLSADLNSLPTGLVLTGAVESTDILMEVHGLCRPRLSSTQKQTGRKHQPSISTNLLTSSSQKKQISLAEKSIQHFSLTDLRDLEAYP